VSWQLAPGELEALLSLSPRERYGLCVQLAVDAAELWGLRNPDGWVLAEEAGRDALPLWPHADFAAACARGGWADAAAAAIGLDELLDDLLPLLEEDGVAVAVFPAPDGGGSVVTPASFRRDLEAEIEIGEPG
jgi:uncharacterized protein DUF2750